ncbi:ABC-type antimicrobial peptide transport system, permease component [Thaumarchaeota archaeon SCGC AB-539-E09]|nr:ABC-type antimicrobial peptide transport system, permease component [Thaumarchaeota archaeon SCGC AB-539-E09]
MNLRDVAITSFGGIRDRKFRFALNLLGILIGCAAVTGLISVTQGMNTAINSQLDILGANTITIIPTTGDSDIIMSGPQAMNSPVSLSWRDLQIIENIPEIDNVAPIQSNYCSYTITGDTHISQVMGIGVDIFEINPNFEVSSGRTLTRNDKAATVIGSKVAHPDNEEEPILRVGDRLKVTTVGTTELKEMTLRIIGVSKESGQTMGVSPDNMIMIPLRTSEQFFESSGSYDTIMASVYNLDDIDTVTSQIEDKIEDVQIVSAESAKGMIADVTGTIEAVLGGIAAISLLVAGVGIVNTMTVSVSERTQEIGVLKAIGAKNVDILMIFLAESGYTGLAGGLFGGAFGFVLGIMIGDFIGLPVSLNLMLWAMVTLFAIITSILAGVWPAWRAANLNPVEALRHE